MAVIETSNDFDFLKTPKEVMLEIAERVRTLRLEQNITQQELADRAGVAIGTIKRFEKTGEIQFNTLLMLALILGRLEDFSSVFAHPDVPDSLFHETKNKIRKRAGRK